MKLSERMNLANNITKLTIRVHSQRLRRWANEAARLEEELEQWKRPILCHWCKEGVTDVEAYVHYKSCAKHPLTARLASARAIMQKFVDKVDRGMARSIETYAEMKQWMEDE